MNVSGYFFHFNKPFLIKCFICFILFFKSYASEIKVVLEPFNRSLCTSCEEGLVAGKDRLVLVGKIDLPKQIDLNIIPSASFISRKDEFSEENHPFIVPLNQCDDKSKAAYCESTEQDNVKIIYMNVSANDYKLLSQMEMFLRIAVDHEIKDSNIVKLPKIYDDNKVKLFLNKQEIEHDCSNVKLDQLPGMLELCCAMSPSPCEVTIHYSRDRSVTSKTCVNFEPPDSGVLDLELSFKLCGQTYQSRPFQCRLDLGPKASNEESQRENTFIITAVIIVVLVIFGIIIWFAINYCFFRKGTGSHRICFESETSKKK